MAQSKQNKVLSENEKIEFLKRQEKHKLSFEALSSTLQLIDLERSKTITTNTYSRDLLRTYLKNPATEANQKNLRNLSNFLYTVSHVYRRLVNFKADQIKCKAWTAYPIVSMIEEENDPEAILASYNRTCNIVRNMSMESQIQKMMRIAWKCDCAFGFTYGDPEKDGEFFIYPLPNDYCKIASQQFYRGVYGVAFDLSYFDANESHLEFWDAEFTSMYNTYKSDTSQRWQILPQERAFCLKINVDNLEYPVIPLSGMLEQIISLTDLQGVQDLIDEMQAYKLIWAKIPYISGTKEVDDFALDLELANDFYAKLQTALPDNVTIAMSPMELEAIEFHGSDASDSNMISDAYSNLIEANGGIVLNSNRITNSTSFKLALKCDSEDAMLPVEQINAWVNLYLRLNYNIEDVQVEYSSVSPYFEDEKIDQLLKLAQYSMPVKTELISLTNSNPIKAHGMEYLESTLLGIGTKRWVNPLVSSNTQSSLDNSQEKETSELSDEGIDTRDQNKNG